MRPYTPKDNVQKKAYYTDRFWVAPRIPEDPVPEGDIYAEDVAAVKKACKVLGAYLQRGQLVIVINAKDNVTALKTLKEERGYEMLSEMSAVDFLAQRVDQGGHGFPVGFAHSNLQGFPASNPLEAEASIAGGEEVVCRVDASGEAALAESTGFAGLPVVGLDHFDQLGDAGRVPGRSQQDGWLPTVPPAGG